MTVSGAFPGREPPPVSRVLFHPDYTVGPGVKPGLLTSLPLKRALAG